MRFGRALCALGAGLLGGALAQSDECAASSAEGFDYQVGPRRVSVFILRPFSFAGSEHWSEKPAGLNNWLIYGGNLREIFPPDE